MNNVAQSAALAALTGDPEPAATMKAAFARRRGVIVDLLANLPGFECRVPDGAFYVFPSVKQLVGRTIAGHAIASSIDLTEVLLVEAGVAVVPGEAFGAPGHLRFSYALGEPEIVTGIRRMNSYSTASSAHRRSPVRRSGRRFPAPRHVPAPRRHQ